VRDDGVFDQKRLDDRDLGLASDDRHNSERWDAVLGPAPVAFAIGAVTIVIS
jgi:hypothetical protein